MPPTSFFIVTVPWGNMITWDGFLSSLPSFPGTACAKARVLEGGWMEEDTQALAAE